MKNRNGKRFNSDQLRRFHFGTLNKNRALVIFPVVFLFLISLAFYIATNIYNAERQWGVVESFDSMTGTGRTPSGLSYVYRVNLESDELVKVISQNWLSRGSRICVQIQRSFLHERMMGFIVVMDKECIADKKTQKGSVTNKNDL